MAFLGLFWYYFKTCIYKTYSKSKQTKYLGFVKSGVRWAERDNVYCFKKNFYEKFRIRRFKIRENMWWARSWGVSCHSVSWVHIRFAAVVECYMIFCCFGWRRYLISWNAWFSTAIHRSVQGTAEKCFIEVDSYLVLDSKSAHHFGI